MTGLNDNLPIPDDLYSLERVLDLVFPADQKTSLDDTNQASQLGQADIGLELLEVTKLHFGTRLGVSLSFRLTMLDLYSPLHCLPNAAPHPRFVYVRRAVVEASRCSLCDARILAPAQSRSLRPFPAYSLRGRQIC